MNSLESRYADGIAKSGGVWREQDSCLQQSGNRFAVDPRTNRLACATCNERPCWTGFHVSQSARPAFVPFYRIRTARKGRCAEQQVLPSPTVQPAHASSYFGECAYRDGASSQSCLARPEGPGATAFEEIRERPLMAGSGPSECGLEATANGGNAAHISPSSRERPFRFVKPPHDARFSAGGRRPIAA